MTMRRALGLCVAGLMVLVGGVWWGQGLGWIGGSSMTDDSTWTFLGALTAGLGIALAIVVVQHARRSSGDSEMDKRYGGKR